jgi:hypothetical protein
VIIVTYGLMVSMHPKKGRYGCGDQQMHPFSGVEP